MGKRGLVALLDLSSWCPVVVERLFLAVPQGCVQFVIVVFPDHAHLLFVLFFLSVPWVDLGCVIVVIPDHAHLLFAVADQWNSF